MFMQKYFTVYITLTLPLVRLSGSQLTFRLQGEWVGILIVHYCNIPRISVFGYSWEIRIHQGPKFCLRALAQSHFLVGILRALHISSRWFVVMNYLYPDLQKKNGLFCEIFQHLTKNGIYRCHVHFRSILMPEYERTYKNESLCKIDFT